MKNTYQSTTSNGNTEKTSLEKLNDIGALMEKLAAQRRDGTNDKNYRLND